MADQDDGGDSSLVCAVCAVLYQDAVLLSCDHNVCRACTLTLASKPAPDGGARPCVRCPTCCDFARVERSASTLNDEVRNFIEGACRPRARPRLLSHGGGADKSQARARHPSIGLSMSLCEVILAVGAASNRLRSPPPHSLPCLAIPISSAIALSPELTPDRSRGTRAAQPSASRPCGCAWRASSRWRSCWRSTN
jgi:hypothetical protein